MSRIGKIAEHVLSPIPTRIVVLFDRLAGAQDCRSIETPNMKRILGNRILSLASGKSMPIYECDHWREQYFCGTRCPPDVHIPTDDTDGCRFNPRYRWVYNKLLIAKSQGLICGLHDLPPPQYPVFCKPVVNLKGMGIGTCVLHADVDYLNQCHAEDYWMPLLRGEHISTDYAVVNGDPMWSRHSLAMPAVAGTFDYWVVEARPRPALEEYCRDWMTKHLRGYTGMLNIETIGGYIIEVHLRFADQWPDLNGRGWLDSVVRLYELQQWQFEDRPRRDGYSVVLFGPHGREYSYPRSEQSRKYRAARAISSVQITFCEDLASTEHSMPPGGFRLAIINTHNLGAGLRLRAVVAQDFGIYEQGDVEDHVDATLAADEANA
jgi:hypothetical protein